MFHWSNYWDFVIYFVVIAGFSLYGALYRYHARAKETIGTVLLQAAEVFAIGTIVALPFTMKFETMVSGVGIAKHHSMLYQLAILWGLPTVLVVLFIAAVLLAWRKTVIFRVWSGRDRLYLPMERRRKRWKSRPLP